MQETWVQSQGQADPLEKEMATHSSILVWEIPWTEEPVGLLMNSDKTTTNKYKVVLVSSSDICLNSISECVYEDGSR